VALASPQSARSGIVLLTPPLLPAGLQALRLFRLLRLLRLALVVKQSRRLFSPDGVKVAALVAGAAALGGAAIFADVEQRYSLWDGIWWAVSTMATIGGGNVVRHTVIGRIVGMVLMPIGIGFFALLTGAIAHRFLAPSHVSERSDAASAGDAQLLRELRRLEERLAQIETGFTSATRGRQDAPGRARDPRDDRLRPAEDPMALAAAERRGFKLGLVGEPNRMSSHTDLDAAGPQTRTDRRERRRLQRPLCVLVVDEEPMYRALSETILSSQGDDVVSVDNAPAQGDGSQLASVGADRLAKPFTALQLADAIEKALALEDDAA